MDRIQRIRGLLECFDALDASEVLGVTVGLRKREGSRMMIFETALGFWFSRNRTPLS
jgi:hypothetical protein